MAAVATGMDSARSSRWVVATLVGSLALNLVVIGAIASSLWRDRVEERSTGRVPRSVVGYASTLPDARVKELKSLAEERWRDAELLRRELQKARTEAIKALTAEPLDKQRFLEAQSLLLATDLKYRAATTKLNSAIGLNLTPEERRDFQRWRERQRPVRNPLDAPGKPGNAAQ
jgi:uncharacterized membrane protein